MFSCFNDKYMSFFFLHLITHNLSIENVWFTVLQIIFDGLSSFYLLDKQAVLHRFDEVVSTTQLLRLWNLLCWILVPPVLGFCEIVPRLDNNIYVVDLCSGFYVTASCIIEFLYCFWMYIEIMADSTKICKIFKKLIFFSL